MNTETYEDLEPGDRILFNDRKQPLKVEELMEDRVLVEGTQGGEYQIYSSEGKLLFSKRDSRRYASYCKNLRKVGRWIEEENHYYHTETGAELKLEKNEIGYWEIEINGLKTDIDQPKYGYSEKEEAVKDIEKVVRKNPEG